ncbi:MAG: D-glycerate dehydrogenase [Betaproteobacteria bacterium]|nr:D-glycerate dehydrogenase [Betaproteobacteria bacterium]
MAVIVVEDDRVLRLLQVLLDPAAPQERGAAYADYVAHDLADFEAWRASARSRLARLFPASVRMVATEEELRAQLHEADALVVESLGVSERELAAAGRLVLVHKFGMIADNVDLAACARRRVTVRTLRRRTNIAVAEHTLALMLALAKQIHRLNGKVSVERLQEAGYAYRKYDTRHTGANNYGRVGGLRLLRGMALGLLGMGEIGREVAGLARVFGMNVLYHQRRRLPREDETKFGIDYRAFADLFADSDVVSIHVPLAPDTRRLVDRAALQRMKPGAWLINNSRAEVIERAALIEALESGKLGAAGLDVHYQEPCAAADPLMKFENVILTPHYAGGPRSTLLDDIEEVALGVQQALAARGKAA